MTAPSQTTGGDPSLSGPSKTGAGNVPRRAALGATRSALRVVLPYVAFALLWIYVSNRIAFGLSNDATRLAWWSLWEGFAFVGITAALLFFHIRQLLARTGTAYRETALAEERFRALISATSAVFWRADPSGVPIESIPGPVEFTGFAPETFERPHGWKEAFHPDDRDRVVADWRKAVASGQEFYSRYRVARKDGAWRDMVGRAVPVRNDDGSVREWFGIDVDVTEQKAANKALRLQAHILNSTGDAVIATDRVGKVIYVNRAAENLYGWSAAEVIGRDIVEITAPDESMQKEIIAQLRTGGVWSGEVVLRRKDGTVFPAFVSTNAVVDEHGEVSAMVGISRDISPQKQAQQELVTRNAQLEEAQALAEMGSWEWDAERDQLHWSNETYRIFGIPAGAPLTQMSFLSSVHPEDSEGVKAAVAGALTGTHVYDEVFRIVSGTGQTRTIHSRGRVVRDANGRPLRMFGMIQDVTVQKETELTLNRQREELRALAKQTNRVREQEAIRISRELHDELGQALTGLTFDVADVQRRIASVSANGEADVVEAKLQQINQRLHDTIETTRRICTELRPAMLDQLGLAAAIEWQTKEFEARTGILCDLALPANDPPVDQDAATAAFRIFQELLTNIARHSKATEAHVQLAITAGELTLSVSDNGSGIASAEIYEPSGLGLVGARERAEAAGGRIEITARKNRGTTTVLTLPVKERRNGQT